MRKNWKKVLSLVLALAMVLNMNVAAFADEIAPETEPVITEEAPADETAPAAEEPAEAEAPAEAAEEPAAAEPEAAAPVEAETENEDAAEGNESAPNTVINSGTTVSGVTITFEKHGSVISDNKGNLTIKKNAIVGLAGTADADITVTVEDGAEVYVGAELEFDPSKTDREVLKDEDFSDPDLEKVTFAGSGTLYFGKKNDEVSVNATNTVDMSKIGGSLVISANEYRFYTNTDGDGYDATSFTGLSGKLQIFNMTNADFDSGAAPLIAKSVSAADYSMSVNSGIGVYKNGKFAPDSTAVSGASIGEGKDFNFGETVFYHVATPEGFYYTVVSSKNDTPDSSKVVGAPNDLMESSWRPDGIDLEEAVVGALTYDAGTEFGFNNTNVEFTIVPKGGAAPDQIKSVWAKYNYAQGNHKTFNTLADGKTISANTDYDLYARNVSETNPNPAANSGFYSDVVKVGSFTTKETPTEITIPSAKTITYQGDATKEEAMANNPFLNGFNVTFKDKDGKDTKKLTIGTDDWADGYIPYGDYYGEDEKFVGLAVKIDGSTVGVLKNYIVLSANGLSADAVAKMDQPAIASASKKTLGGMKTLEDGNGSGDIKYLSANTYYVRSFFEAYKDEEYTNVYDFGAGDTDLPYQTASSNVMTLTVEKANLKIVPDFYCNYGDFYDKDNEYMYNYRSYSYDPMITTTSGNQFKAGIYAFDPDKASDEDLAYQRVRIVGRPDGEYGGYFDNEGYNSNKTGVFNGGSLSLALGSGKEALATNVYRAVVAGSTTSANTYKLSVSEGSLNWIGNISENFIVTYPEYTITVSPAAEGSTYIRNHAGLKGYAYYGSTLEAVKRRVFEEYTTTVSGSDTSWIDRNVITWDGTNNVSGNVYTDEACTQQISSDAIMAEVKAGTTVYVSVNKINVVSDNTTTWEYKSVENTVIPVKIEPRPIDVYAHAYPYRGDTYDGSMDPEEVYGDITTNSNVVNYGGRTDNIGYYFGFDEYYKTGKRSYFQGEDLLASAVKAKNADVVDTTETTFKWYSGTKDVGTITFRDGTKNKTVVQNDYVDDSFKVYLDVKTGIADAGSALGTNLKGNYYINTGVGYVSVLPKYTVAYMLQYEDPRNDNGKNADKLVAYTYKSISKEEIKDANKNNKEKKFTFSPVNESKAGLTVDEKGNAVDISTWAAADGTLNAEDGDKITGWKWGDTDIVGDFAGTSGATWTVDEDIFLWAVVSATAGSYIQIESIAPVKYEGLAHVAKNETKAWSDTYENYNLTGVKSRQVNDLTLTVKDTSKGGSPELLIGRDYTVTYKNNINASVYFVDNGKTSMADKVKPNYTKKSKKPQVIIKGAGRYKDKFKATIYFDIYPTDIEGADATYIESLEDYYDSGNKRDDAYDTIDGVKNAYFAKTGKTAKVSYKVKNVQAPSKVELNSEPQNYTRYGIVADWDKAKIQTLKKNKDYAESWARIDYTEDKNENPMGPVPVTATQLTPESETGATRYVLTVKGKGNYTGELTKDIYVYNSGKVADISKLKITTPKTMKWEDLMLNADNTLRSDVDLTKLGINVESKKKTTRKNDTGKGQVVSFTGNWTYDIYKVDKTGKIEYQVVNDGNMIGGTVFDDAGTYKIVVNPYNYMLTETVSVYDNKGDYDKKKSKTTYYAGQLEKTFTIKGVTLKKSDFKLAWTSKKWNGKNDAQSLSFKKAVPQTLTKGKLNQVYVDKYLKQHIPDTFEPFWNADDKRFEAYVRDYCLYNGETPDEAVQYIMKNYSGAVLGDVYYYDDGLAWANPKQIDVYRYTFEAAGANKDVGTYGIYVDTDGVFGTDGLYITYKRTGTATKILSIEEAK